MNSESVVTIAGGVGAAKFLRGLSLFRGSAFADDTAVVNVADDFELHGLRICPDLDTVTYTLSGRVNPDTGWGRADETWTTKSELESLGGQTWFSLGDKDLAVHLYRTQRTSEGASLAQITAELADSLGARTRIVPATEASVKTMIHIVGEGETSFQDYFVGRRHSVEVESVRFDGVEHARPADGVMEALEHSGCIVIAPSNPIVSIGPVMAVEQIGKTVTALRDKVVAVSPIVGGRALKGPADRMLTELGHEPTVVGIARLYREFASTLVIDEADADSARSIEDLGVRCVITNTVMTEPAIAASLAETTVAAILDRRTL